MTDYESDLDQSRTKNLLTPKKIAKTVTIEKDKKWTTKMMIKDALIELKTRKGVSVYAIKKYLAEKFQADTERLNYIIRKTLRTGVDDGTFIQVKGAGASGSFKLAVVKEKVKKTIKKKKPEKTDKEVKKMVEKTDKATKKTKPEKEKIEKTKQKNLEITTDMKKVTKEVKAKKTTEKKKEKPDKPVEETSKAKEKKTKSKMAEPEEKKKEKKTKTKTAKGFETPKKKGNPMMKRKSIGSLRKPPKMKPK